MLKCLWTGYFVFIVLSSWIGDITILVGSIKYRAFKLHKFIVVIIQHIAVCDLMLSTGTYFFSRWAGKLVLGSLFCQWFNYTEYYFNCTSVFLICTLTTSKLLLLKYPIRFGTKSSKTVHSVCGLCWVLALIVPVTMMVVDERDVKFIYGSYVSVCVYGFSSDLWLYIKPLFILIFLLAPIGLVMITSLYLLVLAKRVAHRGRENLKWQGIVTTVTTATVFCISFLPLLVYLMLELILDQKFASLKMYDHFCIAALSIYSLNIISNFYIYSLTVSSFRCFVLSRLQWFFRLLAHPLLLIRVWTFYKYLNLA